MTESNRPPGFKILAANPVCLFLFFGHGDYVIAESPTAASYFWMEHFDDIAYAQDFELISDSEIVEIWVINPMSEVEIAGREDLTRKRCGLLQLDAAWWVKRFGPGYLASTTED